MTDTLNSVRSVLIETLDLQQEPEQLQPDTVLFGSLPELDSFGVVALVAAIEEKFDIIIDDDEFGADLFETLGKLTEFVDSKIPTA